MMRVPHAKTVLVTLLMLGIGLAGCLGGGDDGGSQGTDPDQPQFSEDTGAVSGLVTTDDFLPIQGALVAILGADADLETTTSDSGAFVLSNVPPGTHTLAVQKLGFESAAQSVQVAAGEEVEVEIQLNSVAVEEPWIESLPHTGYMETGIGFVRAATCTGCASNDTSYFMFGGWPDDFEGAVIEAQWETSDFLGFDLLRRADDCGEDGETSCMWYRVRSESPVHFYVERCGDYTGDPTYGRSAMPCTEDEVEASQGTGNGDGHLETWYVGQFQDETHLLDPACQQSYDTLPNYEQGCYGVGVAQDIRWDTWVTIFHLELPPDAQSYTAFPDA